MSMNWISTTEPPIGEDFQPAGASHARLPRPRRRAHGPRTGADPDPLPAPCVGRPCAARGTAAGRPGRLRLLDGDDGARRTGPGPVGRLPSGPGHAHRDDDRRRVGGGRGGRPAGLDTAAQPARRRHGRQRHRHRGHRRRRAVGAARAHLAASAHRDDGGRGGVQRVQHCPLRRRRPWPRSPRRADDRTRGAHRPVGPGGPHVDRGDRAGRRLAARRNGRRRHRPLRARDRPAGAVLRAHHAQKGSRR